MAKPQHYKKHKFRYRWVGRPTKLSPEMVKKLEEAASVDATIEQMCFYAGIAEKTYYNWIDKNPELLQRLDSLRQRRPLKANQNITAAIENGDLALSKWELEKKQPDTYGEKVKLEHSGSIDNSSSVPVEDKEAVSEFYKKLKENRTKRRLEKAKENGELQ